MKLDKRLRNALFTVFTLAGLSIAAKAGEFEMKISTSAGQDSNPYRLSSNSDSGGFFEFDADLDFESQLSGTVAAFVSVEGNTREYSGAADDATERDGEIGGGLEFKWDLPGKDRIKLEIGAETDSKRGTYISRLTGLVGDVNGVPIPDRFDFDRGKLWADFDYYVNYDLQLSLDVDYRDKNYVEDYAALGIDRFDNTEFIVNPTIEYELNDQWELEAFAEFTKRKYDDRRVDDAAGNPVPGTDREYDYWEYGAELAWQPREESELEIGYRTGTREDNGAGYLDYDSADYFLQYEQNIESIGTFSVELYYTEDDYVNASAITNPEEQRSRSGRGIEFEFERTILSARVTGLSLLVEADIFRGDNTTPQFAYDRNEIYVGVTKEFRPGGSR